MTSDVVGSRLDWGQVPIHIRNRVATALGSPVVVAVNEAGGFSPGVAARCRLADGGRCFIKAVSSAQNPDSPGMHRREAAIAAQLPPGLPVPRLLELIDEDGWVVLVFEEVDGGPLALPWSWTDLASTFRALADLAGAATPCPVAGLPTFAERHVEMFSGFRQLADGDPAVGLVDPWTRRHLDRLAELEAGWEVAASGSSLLHSDLRSDNLLVRSDGSIVVVDWPHACVGVPWVDLVCMLPSIEVDGGPSPGAIESRLNPFGLELPEEVDRVVVALAGFFTFKGLQPDPPGLPTLRAFQRAQGDVARTWAASRLALS